MADYLTVAVFLSILRIVLIDLLLAFDNALLIGSATRALEPPLRKRAQWWGTAGAAACRIIFLALIFWIQRYPVAGMLLHLLGGAYIIYVAIKLLPTGGGSHVKRAAKDKFWPAVWLIISADLAMSFDNVIAVYAVSDNKFPLVVAGILISVPMVMIASTFIAIVMKKVPLIIVGGSIFLGWIGGEMISKASIFADSHHEFKFIGAALVSLWALVIFFKDRIRKT